MTSADRVVIDTNVAIYLAKNNQWAGKYRPLVEDKVVAIAFPTAAELLLTSRRSSKPGKVIAFWRERFLKLAILWPDNETCEIWARITAALKDKNFVRQDNDLWIAACAVRYRLPLVTNNPTDFSHIDGLQVITAS